MNYKNKESIPTMQHLLSYSNVNVLKFYMVLFNLKFSAA